jgi:hypothetical protein
MIGMPQQALQPASSDGPLTAAAAYPQAMVCCGPLLLSKDGLPAPHV